MNERRTPIDEHILALRALGVSYPAIATTISHFTGIRMSGGYARDRARRLGAPRDESRVRGRA